MFLRPQSVYVEVEPDRDTGTLTKDYKGFFGSESKKKTLTPTLPTSPDGPPNLCYCVSSTSNEPFIIKGKKI